MATNFFDISPTALVLSNGTVAGTTEGSVSTFSSTGTTYSSSGTAIGKAYNYVVIVKIPVPFLDLRLNLDLLADFILPILTVLGVPKAMLYLTANIDKIVQAILTDIMYLIKAIPEASVTVLVKLGSIVVVNVQLVAEKVPVVVTPPTFELALPNFAADLRFGVTFPAPPPFVVRIPIPYPEVRSVPLVRVTGGHVALGAGSSIGTGAPGAFAATQTSSTEGSAAVIPPTISSPISLPVI